MSEQPKEVFEFGRACVVITDEIAKGRMDPAEEWEMWFPRVIAEEIEEAEKIFPVLGLRSAMAVRQSLCGRMWKFFFTKPLPWAELATDGVSFGKEEMKIELMKEALEISLSDTRAALAIFEKNSLDVSKASPQEPAGDARPTASSASLVAPAASIPETAGSQPPPTAPRRYFDSAHAVSSSAGSAVSDPASEPRAICSFDSWKDEFGNILPCLPGVGPGEIPLPDNMHPRFFLVPVKMQLEAWLNVDLYFVSKSQQSDHNKIQILPGRCRGQPRPAEIDSEYGLRAFNILFMWTERMVEEGEMVPIIEFVRQWFAIERFERNTRSQTARLIKPTVGTVRFPQAIKAISPDKMMQLSQHNF